MPKKVEPVTIEKIKITTNRNKTAHALQAAETPEFDHNTYWAEAAKLGVPAEYLAASSELRNAFLEAVQEAKDLRAQWDQGDDCPLCLQKHPEQYCQEEQIFWTAYQDKAKQSKKVIVATQKAAEKATAHSAAFESIKLL